MRNNLEYADIITRPWYIRRMRGSTKAHPEWSVECDANDGPLTEVVQVAVVYGQESLAQAIRAIPRLVTAASLATFRIQMVLENAKGVLEGHRVGLREVHKLLLDALEEAGRVETKVLRQIVSP